MKQSSTLKTNIHFFLARKLTKTSGGFASEVFASHLSASHAEQFRRVVEIDAEICLLFQRTCLMVKAWQAICSLPSNKMGLEVRPEVRTISAFKANFF